MLSSEYGWTSDQILRISLREVNWRMKAINKRRLGTAKFEASLHGAKLDGSSNAEEEVTVSEDAGNVFDKLLEDKDHGRQCKRNGWSRY